MNFETLAEPRTNLLSARELNAYLDALTESFNRLNLGFIRRSRMFAVPAGWRPAGLTITCLIGGQARGFLALDIGHRLAFRITRYLTPKRTPLTDRDVRIALEMVGDEVVAGMQTRLVHLGIMAKISDPQVSNSDEWHKHHPVETPVGIVSLYSTCGICHLAFNLTNP